MELVIVVKQPNILEPFIKLPVTEGRGPIYSQHTNLNQQQKHNYYLHAHPGQLPYQPNQIPQFDPNTYSLNHPPKAVYETKHLDGLVSFNDNKDYEYYYTINFANQALGMLELDGDVCIIKNDDIGVSSNKQFYNIRLFGDALNIDIYHNISIVPQQDIISQLKSIFHTRLSSFGGEATYKIMRRCTLLMRFLGYNLIEDNKFKDLLRIDCMVLNNAANRLAQEFGLSITRNNGCIPTNRHRSQSNIDSRSLMNFLHFMLVNNNIRLPVTLPIVDHIEAQIISMNKTIQVLNQIYVSSREIMDLRALVNINSGNTNELSAKLNLLVLENNCLTSEFTDIKSQLEILKLNAIRDEKTIETLRAEKAHWSRSTSGSFDEQQKREKELKELRDKINSLLSS